MRPRAETERVHRFVAGVRRATLATVALDGSARLVPICFAATGGGAATEAEATMDLVLYSPIDQKPKRGSDPMRLARVRDLLARPQATVLVDRWSEDWDQLGWVRLDCQAEILSADGADDARARAIGALRAKYPQYRAHNLEQRPLIRLTCSVAASWGAIEEET